MNLPTIAHEMKSAQDTRRQVEPFTKRVSGFDIAAAYEVGRLIHEARVHEGAVPVGRKIGFTNRDMWYELGVYEPIWAHVYNTTVVRLSDARATCRLGRFTEPRIEPEIVLHFRSAPVVNDDPVSIVACLDWIAHGIEIVQSHFPGWKFQAADAVADWACHGMLLVGEPQSVRRFETDLVSQLKQCTVTLLCEENIRERGRGSNALGGPLAAAAHLISLLAKQPQAKALQADELVATGTLTRALPVLAGETWTTAIDGISLPGVSVTFEP